MNWSPVVMLRKRPVLAVDATSPTRLRTQLITTRVILSIIPLATMTAPKHMAQRMSQMVLSIPVMPPVDTNSFSSLYPVSIDVAP